MDKKEYIEREAALDALMGQPPDAHYPSWYAAIIKEVPAVDLVEVVRCEKCKYAQRLYLEKACQYGWVCEFDQEHFTPAQHYCAFGERRENE